MEVANSSEIKEMFLRTGSQIIVDCRGETYLRSFSDIIRELTKEQGRRGILISTLWSANALSRRISLSKLPNESLKVIDTLSLSLGSAPPKGDDFVFLPTPVSLESILMGVEKLLITQKGGFNFLIIDSLSIMSKNYTTARMSEFFHFLLNRMLEEEMLVIMFDQGVEEGSTISKEISSFIDETVIITEGGDKK
ncbi:MAG: hypothetical protein R6V01_05075 [Thermoplasmatota archaeon]